MKCPFCCIFMTDCCDNYGDDYITCYNSHCKGRLDTTFFSFNIKVVDGAVEAYSFIHLIKNKPCVIDCFSPHKRNKRTTNNGMSYLIDVSIPKSIRQSIIGIPRYTRLSLDEKTWEKEINRVTDKLLKLVPFV